MTTPKDRALPRPSRAIILLRMTARGEPILRTSLYPQTSSRSRTRKPGMLPAANERRVRPHLDHAYHPTKRTRFNMVNPRSRRAPRASVPRVQHMVVAYFLPNRAPREQAQHLRGLRSRVTVPVAEVARPTCSSCSEDAEGVESRTWKWCRRRSFELEPRWFSRARWRCLSRVPSHIRP